MSFTRVHKLNWRNSIIEFTIMSPQLAINVEEWKVIPFLCHLKYTIKIDIIIMIWKLSEEIIKQSIGSHIKI